MDVITKDFIKGMKTEEVMGLMLSSGFTMGKGVFVYPLYHEEIQSEINYLCKVIEGRFPHVLAHFHSQ